MTSDKYWWVWNGCSDLLEMIVDRNVCFIFDCVVSRLMIAVCIVLATRWQSRIVHSWNATSYQSQGYFCALCHSESSWSLWWPQGLYSLNWILICFFVCMYYVWSALSALTLLTVWYGDSVDNTVDENSSVFSLIRISWLPSVNACRQ